MGRDDAPRRALELALVYGVVPFGIAVLRLGLGVPVPVLPTLAVLTVVVLALVSRDPDWRWRDVAARRAGRERYARVARRFLLLAPLLLALVLVTDRSAAFDLPRTRPALWVVVMLGYPIVSVVPQELLFRAALFHRHERWIGGAGRTVVVSALLFGAAHALFGNWPSVLLSTAGGALFGTTWARDRDLWLVSFEHALYGAWIFTVGLGRWFYGGTVTSLDALA